MTIALTTDPGDYLQATSYSNGVATFRNDAGSIDPTDNPLEPGWYTVTVVDPTGTHEPYKQDMYFDFGGFQDKIVLPDLTTAPGFSVDPAIAQTLTVVGTSYTVSATAARSSDPTTEFSYQWLRNGQPIFGATDASYTSTGADVGTQLSVQVGVESFGFAPVYAFADVGGNATPTVTTVGDAPVVVPDAGPTISPSTGVFVGTTLQANVGSWTIDGNPASGLSFTYLWTNDANSDTGTGSTYVVQPGDIGADISVTVTAHEAGFTDSAPATSSVAVTPGVHAAPVVTKAPVVTHALSHGVTTYSVSTGSWNTTGLTYSYAWSLGSTPVGTDSHSITSTTVGTALPASDPLTVVVTATKTGYLAGSSIPVLATKGTTAFTNTADATILDTTTSSDVSAGDGLDFGDHLTVSQPGTWTPMNGFAPSGYSYQWYRSFDGGTTWLPIAGATTGNYTISAADDPNAGTTQISVVETPVSAYYAAVGHRTNVGHALSIEMPIVSSLVTLSGAAVAGHTLTASMTGWGVAGVTNTYQWLDCPPASLTCTDPTFPGDYLAIAGATKSSLVLQADYGYVFVLVTGSKTGYTWSTADHDPVQVLPATTVVDTSVPRISGLIGGGAPVGAKLTAIAGAASVSGTTTTYQWQVQECSPGSCNGTWTNASASSTGSTYVPVVADYASGDWSIRVEQTSHHSGDTSVASDSAAYPLVLGTLKLVKAASVTSTPVAYTFTPATYSPAAGEPTVQWEVDGVPSGPATTTPPFTFSRPAAASALVADVTYSVAGYTPIMLPVLVQRGVTTVAYAESIQDPASITGPHLGDQLSAGVGNPYDIASGDVPTLAYQWYSNGVAISHATTDVFTPTSAYIGKHLTLRVTGSSPDYTTVTEVSPAVTLLGGVFDVPSAPAITYSGSAQPGTVLTAVPDTADYGYEGITFLYQWQRSTNAGASYTSISGATHSTYTPIATDVTDDLRVIVTATRTGFASRSDGSDPVTVQYSPSLATFIPPTLVGSSQVASALTVNVGTWNAPALTYTYQWFVGGSAMPAATGASFIPLASEIGDSVSVQVTAHGAGYLPVAVSSNVDVIALASAPTATVLPVITDLGGGLYRSRPEPGTWTD